MKCRTTLQILDTSCTSPTSRIKTLVGLIPIYLYLKKLVKWSCLRTTNLLSLYVLVFLFSTRNSQGTFPYPQLLDFLNDVQYAHLKSLLLDTEVSLLNLTKPFNLLNAKAIPDCRLLDKGFLITYILRLLLFPLLSLLLLIQVLHFLKTYRLSLLYIFRD